MIKERSVLPGEGVGDNAPLTTVNAYDVYSMARAVKSSEAQALCQRGRAGACVVRS